MSQSYLCYNTKFCLFHFIKGNKKSHEEEDHPKAILVDAGGTLEIHGEPRLSWTKIIDTLVPHTGYDSGHYYFNHQVHVQLNQFAKTSY